MFIFQWFICHFVLLSSFLVSWGAFYCRRAIPWICVVHNKLCKYCSHLQNFAKKAQKIREPAKTGRIFEFNLGDASFEKLLVFSLVVTLHPEILFITLRHRPPWHEILTARFKTHFWEQSCPTFMPSKIVNFAKAYFKFWNCAYTKIDFSSYAL